MLEIKTSDFMDIAESAASDSGVRAVMRTIRKELERLQQLELKAVELSVAVINDPHTMELGCLCRDILDLTGERGQIVAMKAVPTAEEG